MPRQIWDKDNISWLQEPSFHKKRISFYNEILGNVVCEEPVKSLHTVRLQAKYICSDLRCSVRSVRIFPCRGLGPNMTVDSETGSVVSSKRPRGFIASL